MLPSDLVNGGGRSDVTRRHNLALVLRRVHLAPIRRSELTRLSGLNRSTIGDLVVDLGARGLVVEDAAPGESRAVGRPSPLVRPGDAPVAIAVNPEVDAVAVGLVQLGGRVLRAERVPADRPTPEAAVAIAAAAAERLLEAAGPGRRVLGAGAAVPGIVRSADGLIRLAPHLRWRDVPFAALLGEALGVPAFAANDAGLGARAEWTFGAGELASDMVYLNGGASGIGGGIISGGVLVGGATGHAGEFGHTSVRRRGRVDAIGAQGSLESEVTRARLLEVAGLPAADAGRLEEVLLAGRAPAVRAEVQRQVDYLGIALGNAVDILNPGVVVLGGFLAALAAVEPDRLRHRVAERALPSLGEPVDIRRARLGADILLIGAGELAFAPVLADPGLVDPVG